MLTDTHCHLDFNKFDEDREAVIKQALDARTSPHAGPRPGFGVEPGCDPPGRYASRDLLRHWIPPYGCRKVGYISSYEKLKLLTMETGGAPELDKKIVAIGEIGLDYYWVKEPEKQAHQRDILKKQLQLASEVSKPVVIHMREENDAWFGQASIDLLEILQSGSPRSVQRTIPWRMPPEYCIPSMGTWKPPKRPWSLTFISGSQARSRIKMPRKSVKSSASCPSSGF